MYRTTSVLALGLFIGLAPIGALAQTQSTDTDTQLQTTQSTDTQTQTETLQTDDQESTDVEVNIPRDDDTDVATDTDTDKTTDDDAEMATDEDVAADDEADLAATDTEEVPDVIPEQDTSEMLGSSLMGASVNLADEEIGNVSDLIITGDYTIRGVVVGVGGFLGIGEKRVALPVERLTIQTIEPGEVEISTDMTREELEQKEAFKTAVQVRSEEEAARAQQEAEAQQPVAPTVPAPAE
ncbi:MAG TPA: PRC-barrel domain-containing protein [Aestuariivirgaceae bacterium]|nr:PRC-barrel domain-containing protein [Aestuariivirgaceae bacterium]